jgi:cystathionine gamma-lyase
MDHDNGQIVARMLHHRGSTLQPGEPLGPPIVPASLYHLPGEPTAPHQYGRWTNPTWTVLEETIGVLEEAPSVIFPSGMAAIAAVLFSQLRPGDRVLLPADGYYTTRSMAERYLAPMGVSVELCATAAYDGRDLAGLRLVYVETPSNPGLDICDLSAVASRAKAAGALVVADNTTMTALGQRPLELGADAVVASDTKALNGHSDVMFGHVASRDGALIEAVRDWRKLVGAIPGPFEAWLVHRGLESLELRFERMCRNAGTIAERLAGHRSVRAVRYPGLPGHPGHAVAKRQMDRFGHMVGIELADAATADAFIDRARFVRPATSFGGMQTTAERRARWADQVAPGYVRLSAGCEPTEALWSDIARVLGTL